MKPSHLLISAGILITAGSLLFLRLYAEGNSISVHLEQERVLLQKAVEARAVRSQATESEFADLSNRLSKIRSQLAEEKKSVADAMTRQAELRSKLPAMDSDDFVVSFGRIRDMATELGELVQLYQRIMGRKGQKLSPEENERLMASGVKMMSWLPEIASFEDTPAEISCLQTGMIAKAFGLDSAATSRVEEITRDHFAQMKTTGATAASRERPGWREQRTAAISQLMWKLRPILPPNSQLISSLPTMLNLGAGMEEQVDVKIDAKGESHGTISMSLPTWPAVPWLPRK